MEDKLIIKVSIIIVLGSVMLIQRNPIRRKVNVILLESKESTGAQNWGKCSKCSSDTTTKQHKSLAYTVMDLCVLLVMISTIHFYTVAQA